jgi:cytochrome c553
MRCSLGPMKRWLTNIPVTLSLVGAIALGACTPEEVAPPPLPPDSASVVRGQQLAEGFGSCGFCHSMKGTVGQALSGGRVLNDMFGEVSGPNITLAESGIGQWSESDVRALFRAQKRPDGSLTYTSLHQGFEWLSDSDLTALIAYLRTRPANENVVERRAPSAIERNLSGYFYSAAEVHGYVPQISPSFRVEYGEYLANNVAGCARCHSKPAGLISSSEYLAGGQEIVIDGESKIAPNITSSKIAGVGDWSEADLKRYFASGATPSGREVDKRFCPVDFYASAGASEIDSVVAYIRSVPAID